MVLHSYCFTLYLLVILVMCLQFETFKGLAHITHQRLEWCSIKNTLLLFQSILWHTQFPTLYAKQVWFSERLCLEKIETETGWFISACSGYKTQIKLQRNIFFQNRQQFFVHNILRIYLHILILAFAVFARQESRYTRYFCTLAQNWASLKRPALFL